MANQLESAIETQGRASGILEKLVDNFEHDLAFQIESGISLRQLAEFLTVRDKTDPQITEVLARSELVLSIAVVSDSLDTHRVTALANTCQAQAEALQLQNRPAEALASIDRSIATLGLILDDDPAHAAARDFRYFAAVTRAELLTDLERYPDSLNEWDVAIQLAPRPSAI